MTARTSRPLLAAKPLRSCASAASGLAAPSPGPTTGGVDGDGFGAGAGAASADDDDAGALSPPARPRPAVSLNGTFTCFVFCQTSYSTATVLSFVLTSNSISADSFM